MSQRHSQRLYYIGILHAIPALVVSLASVWQLAAAAEPGKDGDLSAEIARVRTDLKSDDVAVRRRAIGSLVHSRLSPMMLAEMRGALKDPDGEVRATAGTCVGNLRTEAVAAVPDLISQLQQDPVKEARETAARALGRIGESTPDERRAVEPLTKAGRDDPDPVTRVVALGSLAMMQVDKPKQIVALRTHLHHDQPLVRMKAAHALGMIGNEAKAASAEIVDVLKTEPDEHRRGYVARAVGNVGDPAALPALYDAYRKETYAGARGEMRGAIRKLGGEAPKE